MPRTASILIAALALIAFASSASAQFNDFFIEEELDLGGGGPGPDPDPDPGPSPYVPSGHYELPIEPIAMQAATPEADGWYTVGRFRFGTIERPNSVWFNGRDPRVEVMWFEDHGTASFASVVDWRIVEDIDRDGRYDPSVDDIRTFEYPSFDAVQRRFGGFFNFWYDTLYCGSNEEILVQYQLAGEADGTFQIVVDPDHYNGAEANMRPAYGSPAYYHVPWPTPLSEVVTQGVVVVANDVAASVAPGQTDVTILDTDTFAVTGPGGTELLSITARLTAGNPALITNIRLVNDLDDDGEFDATDEELAVVEAFDATGEVVFDLTGSKVLPMEYLGEYRLLIVVDFAEALPHGMAFGVAMIDGSVSDVDMELVGLPVESTFVALTPSNPGLTVQITDASDRTAPAGSAHATVATIVLALTDVNGTFDSLTIRGIGGGNDPVHVIDAIIWRDVNGNGRRDGVGEPGGDYLMDRRNFLEDNGSLTFSVEPVEIAAGGVVRLLLTYSLADTVPAGTMFGAELTAVGLTPMDAVEVPVTGLPAMTPSLTVTAPEAVADEDGDGSEASGGTGSGAGDQEMEDLFIGGATDAGLLGVGCTAGAGNPVLAALLVLLAVGLLAARRRVA